MASQDSKGTDMGDEVETQIYLSIPADLPVETLTAALGTGKVACVRCTAGGQPGQLDSLREACHASEVPLLVDAPDGLAADLAKRHGLDGVHVAATPKTIAYARKSLGNDAIIGGNAGTSRHDGMNAAESGADYVAFAADADSELLTWWAQVVETPFVAGVDTLEQAGSLAGIADFVCIGLDSRSPEAAVTLLQEYAVALQGSDE